MTALTWDRDLHLGSCLLRPAATADADGLSALMAEPEVEQWWHQGWRPSRWAEHLAGLLHDPGSMPLTLSDGQRPIGYVEVYRVSGDVLGRHIEHADTDLGMHIALGRAARGRGLGRRTMGAVLGRAQGILPGCGRVVAEPDVRNVRSRRAFADAGFESVGVVRLPDKTADLMAASPRGPSGTRADPSPDPTA